MENLNIAKLCAKTLWDKKGDDVVVLQIEEKSSFADYLVIGTAASINHTEALSDYVEDALAKENILPKSIEGKVSKDWILMDYGDVIVNIFTQEARDKYNIEKVWGDCPAIEIEL